MLNPMGIRTVCALLLGGILLSGCAGRVSTAPGVGSSPRRQFDPATSFLPGIPYPEEVLSVPYSDLLPLACTPEYFSWSGAALEFVDPSTGERHPLSDPALLSHLEAVRQLDPGKSIVSIFLCETSGAAAWVFFRAGPCGGGCAGIPSIAQPQEDGSLKLLATVQPDGDGAYFGCRPLQLSRDEVLFLSCPGEGTESIRRVNLATGDVSVILRCQVLEDGATCVAE